MVGIHKHTETIFTHELQPGKSGVLVYCPKVIFHHIYHKTNYLHESHSHFWMHIWFRQRTHIHFVGITTITRATLPWYSEHDTHLVRVCCQVKDSYSSFPMYMCESSETVRASLSVSRHKVGRCREKQFNTRDLCSAIHMYNANC